MENVANVLLVTVEPADKGTFSVRGFRAHEADRVIAPHERPTDGAPGIATDSEGEQMPARAADVSARVSTGLMDTERRCHRLSI